MSAARIYYTLLGVSLLLGGCAHLPPDDPADPLEPVNRGIYSFNRTLDTYALRPVAKGYKDYVPGEVRTGVSNFLDNLFYPTTIVNDLFQAKFVQGGKDLARFTLNTTVGLAGILDVATPLGLQRNDEDLGQTFGRWGVGEGWYLMLPFFGPSSNRDVIGRVGDTFTSATTYVDTYPALAVTAVDTVHERSELLDADRFLDEQLDPYVALRTIYLQNRQSKIYDGNPPKEKFDFEE